MMNITKEDSIDPFYDDDGYSHGWTDRHGVRHNDSPNIEDEQDYSDPWEEYGIIIYHHMSI